MRVVLQRHHGQARREFASSPYRSVLFRRSETGLRPGADGAVPNAVNWMYGAVACLGAFAAGWMLQTWVIPFVLPSPHLAQRVVIAPSSPVPEPVAVAIDVAPLMPPAPPERFVAKPLEPASRQVDFANRLRLRFVARVGERSTIAPGITLQVLRIDVGHGRFDAELRWAAESSIKLRNQAALKAIAVPSDAQTADLIITTVTQESLTGYIVFPPDSALLY